MSDPKNEGGSAIPARIGQLAKSAFFRLSLVVAAVVISVVACEVGLRLFVAKKSETYRSTLRERKTVAEQLITADLSESVDRVFRDHPLYGYTMRPNFAGAPWGWYWETDRYGFRNGKEFDFKNAPEGVAVVGLFGGSAAFGWEIGGDRGTLSHQLETLLSTGSPEIEYKVVNLAIPAWHYPQQFILLARIVQHLDGIITYDGFNEVFVPVANTLDYARVLPPDFPAGLVYLPSLQLRSPKLNVAMYGLLEYERSYDPAGLLANLHLYDWIRYHRWSRKRTQTQRIVQAGEGPVLRAAVIEESPFTNDPDNFDTLVGLGVSEHAKYTRLVDLVAAEHGVPVLHVLQPFLYCNPEVRVSRAKVPDSARIVLANGHPSRHYERLRRRFAQLAREAEGTPGVGYLDLSDALGTDDGNWIDLAHTSPEGNRAVADRILAFMESSGFKF